MGSKSTEWQTKTTQRADEVSRALVRVGVMTYGQITRLLRVHPQGARDVVRHNWDRFEEQYKVPKGVAGGRYVVPGNRVMKLVRLSDNALSNWAEREGIARARNHVRASVLPQVLNIGEILIRLRHTGVAYNAWDIMVPQTSGEGLHAWVVNPESDFTVGLFLLPTRLTETEEAKKGFIFHGILHRVIQNAQIGHTLFLVPERYYATTLRTIRTLEKDGSSFYLLPVEAFMKHPGWFLNAIHKNDNDQRQSLIDTLNWDAREAPPQGQPFASLLQFDKADYYRFVDTWANGSIDRVRSWLKYVSVYQIPKTGHAAAADVYVQYDVMREALEKVLRMKKRGQLGECEVYTEPWLEGMCTPEPKAAGAAERAPLVDPEDLKFDESWLKYFNED